MIDVIKKIVLETVDASQPVSLMFGNVVKIFPLTIMVDNRIELTSEFFVLTELAQQRNLQIGNNVALIRFQGGQQFLVLDRVV